MDNHLIDITISFRLYDSSDLIITLSKNAAMVDIKKVWPGGSQVNYIGMSIIDFKTLLLSLQAINNTIK